MARTRNSTAVAVAVATLMAAAVGAQESVVAKAGFLASGETVQPGRRDPLREPAVRGNFSMEVLGSLRHGYVLAAQKTATIAACGARFDGLKLDGLTALANSRYRAASQQEEAGLCRGAAAITAVGSSDVRLCLRFRTLTVESAATILLHEAMHFAGMSEWPADPNAPRAGQINRAVRESCQL